MVGKTLGHYKIIEPLGKGGMGEVYRARDTKLDRDVAIKVLPEDFATDPERLARFEREAKLLASLNHANIAAIYGLEDEGDQRFIAMELVEGETLAERISRSGRIEVDEALEIARQIAEALEAAHENGVIHRDLKPANVIITPDGKAKVLDFGLAKAYATDGASSDVSPDLSHSPTIMEATRTGVIMGTAAYMSPEQARGKPIDKRTDIWAFGCVLYEMLAGRRVFDGETVSDTIALILKDDPDWQALPARVSPGTVNLLQRCIEKDPRRRVRDIGDAHLAMQGAFDLSLLHGAEAGAESLQLWQRPLPAFVLLVATAIIGTLAGWSVTKESSTALADNPATHLPVGLPPGISLPYDQSATGLAISSRGRKIVFVGTSMQSQQTPRCGARSSCLLYLLDLDQSGPAKPIRGTEGAGNPVLSHNAEWIAFTAGGKLWRVPLGGGVPFELAVVSTPGGIAWSLDDNAVIFVPSLGEGIWSVSADGTGLAAMTTLATDGTELGHRWPDVLPDGRLLYTVDPSNEIVVFDPSSGERTVLPMTGLYARYAQTHPADGHVVFAEGDSLWAARLDLDSLEAGTPTKVLDQVVTSYELHAEYALSGAGALVYQTGVSDFGRTLVRRDREGTLASLGIDAHPDTSVFSISPDGFQLALSFLGSPDGQLRSDLSEQDIFLYDLRSGGYERLTDQAHGAFGPVWKRDGGSLVYTAVTRGGLNIYTRQADHSQPETPLYENEYLKWPHSWHVDGVHLAYTQEGQETQRDIWIYSTQRPENPEEFVATPYNEMSPSFSPNGEWLTFASNETGASEVYLTPFPERGRICLLSPGGGSEPRWSGDGQELFYRQGNVAMVIDVSGGDPCAAEPRFLFDGLEFPWDVSPAGDYFITLAPREAPQLHVVLDWFTELRRLVPTERQQ